MIPLWLKISYTLMVMVIVPIYWRDHGPANFLWLSDVALLVLMVALWLESRLLASMMAVGTLLPELVWVLDFITGGVLGVAGYMYDPEMPLYLRALSLFHLVLPPVMILMLIRFGYDRRALPLQTLFVLFLFPLTWLVSGPERNINWVYGPGMEQELLPPLVYLVLLMVATLVFIHLPSHFVLKRVFPAKSHLENPETGKS